MNNNRYFTDQMGRQLHIPQPPQRVVSLVPSQTEFLYDLGLSEQLSGITKFCIHPEEIYRSKTRVGGTKKYHFDRIAELQPDLIIGNKEENEQKQIEELMATYPVWMSDIKTVEDAYTMMTSLGDIFQKPTEAASIVQQIKGSFDQIDIQETFSVLYLIWYKPFMAAGTDTFIDKMLQLAGFQNVLADDTRYPELSMEDIKSLNPQFILLSSEPFPFKQRHIDEIKSYLPNINAILVDGELFSWYGSRLLHSASYFKDLYSSSKQSSLM